MSDRLRVLVIGAGHNGLTAAAALARAGRSVLVLERRDRVGGLAAQEEFAPGFRDTGVLPDTTCVRPHVVRALQLERFGLRLRDAPETIAVIGDDDALTIGPGDASEPSPAADILDAARAPLAARLDAPPLDLVQAPSPLALARAALRLRRLGRRRLRELLRLAPTSIADATAEWYDRDLRRAGEALPALAGGRLGPRAPGGTILLLRRAALAGPGVVGGGSALVDALRAAAEAAGAEIRTGCPVERLLVGRDGVEGVVADGRTIETRTVAASCDPRQLFERLVPPERVPPRLARNVAGLRSDGTTAFVRVALRRPLRLGRFPDRSFEQIRVVAGLDAIERAQDAAKHRELPARPVLEIVQPTVSRPALAPEGGAVLAVCAHFVPHAPKGGWTPERREAVGRLVLEEIERHAPGLRDDVVAQTVDTPLDLERRYGCHRGQIHHVEHALDQLLVRPTPECASYATPIRGLWLCGSGSHPGGGLTCGPGWLGARALMRG